MALSKEQVEKATKILKEIGKLEDLFFCDYNRDFPRKTGVILTEGKMWGGGYESVFLNIKDMTVRQFDMWQKRKGELNNVSITKQLSDGVTRIGWV